MARTWRGWIGPLVALATLAGALALLILLARQFLLGGGRHVTKAWGVAALALAVAAAVFTPLAWAERAADRRFALLAAALLDARPGASIAPHEGPEGTGYVVASHRSRALLLRPDGGLGPARLLLEDGTPLLVRHAKDIPPAPGLVEENPLTAGERPPA